MPGVEFLSIPGVLLLAVLAAGSTTVHRSSYHLSRGVRSFFRAVPDIVFALVCHDTGVVGKNWAESMERNDPGPQQGWPLLRTSRLELLCAGGIGLLINQSVKINLVRYDADLEHGGPGTDHSCQPAFLLRPSQARGLMRTRSWLD